MVLTNLNDFFVKTRGQCSITPMGARWATENVLANSAPPSGGGRNAVLKITGKK